MSDGNQYVNHERPYASIPGYRPKPKIAEQMLFDFQQRGWDDQLLLPLIQHYRPFNSRLCPFEQSQQWIVKQSELIDGRLCFLLARKQPNVRVAIKEYQYWVAPSLGMSVVRLQRLTNGWVETEFDIQYSDSEVGPEPIRYDMKRFYEKRLLEFAKLSVTKLKLNQPIDQGVFEFPRQAVAQ